jgi:hypothetical protein
MGSCTNNPAARRYLLRFLSSMVVYAICVLISVYAFVHLKPEGYLAYLLAVLPGLPIVASLAAIALYLKEEKDELQRAVMVQAMLWATGGTLSVTTIWGFLENFVHAPRLQLLLIFPLYCFIWGLVTPFVQRRYK